MVAKNYSALAIDDDELALRFYKDYFMAHDVELATALTAEEGLAQLAERVFNVLILDLRLGPTDGRLIMRRVRDEFPAIKVVLVTAHCSVKDEEELLALGAHTILRKPCTMRAVFESVTKAAMLS